MKRLIIRLLVVGIVIGAGAAGYSALHGLKSGVRDGVYHAVAVRRGDIEQVVTSTGTVQPVLSVQVGAFVSGPILEVPVDHNAKVKKGQLLARIHPALYQATLTHEQAALASSKADLKRIEALLEQATRTEKRGKRLKPTNAISETDFDQCVTDRKSLEAQVELAKATIQECEANLASAERNMELCNIRSPVDGIVIDRKVDPGQTVVSQYQTPVLFIVAPNLDETIHVHASVDEADIGLIRDSQARHQPASFTVDAYPREVFHGTIAQVRFNPTTVQNVVTYTVVVETSNKELKLLPGLTAALSFQIRKREGALLIPNAALRFQPRPEHIRPEDRKIVEDDGEDAPGRPSHRDQRYVWVMEGDHLAAAAITVGISDKAFTEVVSGSLTEGKKVVVGFQTSSAR